MAAWDTVQTIGPPSLIPPKVDFSPLGELGNAYYQGQQQQRALAIQRAFQGGLPQIQEGPDKGRPDYTAAANKLFALGAYPEAGNLLKTAAEISLLQQPPRDDSDLYGGRTSVSAPTTTAPPRSPVSSDTAPTGGVTAEPPERTDNRGIGNLTGPNVIAPTGPGQPDPRFAQGVEALRAGLGGQNVPPQTGPAQPSPVQPPQPAQRVAQSTAADAVLPEGYRGNPIGFINDFMQRGLQDLSTAQRQEAVGIKSDALRERARSLFDAAKQVRDMIAPTELQKNALDPNVRRYQTGVHEDEKTSDALAKMADAGIEAVGHSAQLDTIDKLGQRVGYGVVPKMQEFLGRYGIDTKGLSDIQAYERAIDYEAPQLRPIGSGRLMQTELTAFKSALGGLMTTPEGRRISVQNLRLISDFNQRIGVIAADTRLSPSERMAAIYRLPPPQLQTSVPNAQGGAQRAIPPAAIDALRQHPERRAEFDQMFGSGSAARYLGNRGP